VYERFAKQRTHDINHKDHFKYPKSAESLMKIIIIIQPISFELTAELSISLERHLSKDFHALAYYLTTFQWILDRKKTDGYVKILAVCDFDAYSNHLNFVFG
jgi:predicted Zn-dependent protease